MAKNSLFTITLLFTCLMSGFSQTVETKNTTSKTEVSQQAGPRAVVTFKTSYKPNPIIQEVNQLTNHDDVLTERVITKIRKTTNKQIKQIVDDKKYELLMPDEKIISIKKSKVIEIINTLRK